MLLNRVPYVEVNIDADIDSVQIATSLDPEWQSLPTVVAVPRTNKELIITARRGDTMRVAVQRRLSKAYILGNVFTYGAGYLIDLGSTSRFTYPKDVLLLLSERDARNPTYLEWARPVKGTFAFRLSIPYANHFHVHQGSNRFGNSAGFFGVAGGADYFFTQRFCLNGDVGVLIDYGVPFPTPISYDGVHRHTIARFADLQLGTRLGDFRIDAGVQASLSTFFEGDEGVDTVAYSSLHPNGGLALSAQYRLTRTMHVAMNYYPSVSLRTKSDYTHLVFFELGFHIPVSTPFRRRM